MSHERRQTDNCCPTAGGMNLFPESGKYSSTFSRNTERFLDSSAQYGDGRWSNTAGIQVLGVGYWVLGVRETLLEDGVI